MYAAEKTVKVPGYIKDLFGEIRLGYCNKPIYELKDGDWKETDKTEVLFGYVDRWGYMTHMAYTLNTHRHETWAKWINGVKHDRFYFDAGGNGCPIYVMTDVVGEALVELGLIDEKEPPVHKPCDCEECTLEREK